MGFVKVENIRVFAHHGCLPEETIIGSNYRVDLTVKANLKNASLSFLFQYNLHQVFHNFLLYK